MASALAARGVTPRLGVRTLMSFLRRSGTQQDQNGKEQSKTSPKKQQFADCPPRVFSGIQPTGIPHLGNYVGAIRSWVDLQQQHSSSVAQQQCSSVAQQQHSSSAAQQQCSSVVLCIVDLHSITLPQDPALLRQNIQDMAACLLACGIDPTKTILFQQSKVLQHSQLAWVLGCLCTLPRLEHLPQWKEKSEKTKDPGLGLFTYPVLQAADILLYKATRVPVGEDQVHHIELTRHLAKAFNRQYGLVFPHCKALIGEVPKIRSLRNPQSKMSKSEANPLGRIELTDTPDQIAEKIKKAVTDFTSEVTYDPDSRPGVSNLIDIHCALSGQFPEDVCEEAFLKGQDTGLFKSAVTDVVVESLRPVSDRIARLRQDPGYLEDVLKAGAEQAEVLAEQTWQEVTLALGLR